MEIARKKDVLFLESLWTLYLPAIKEVHNIIRNGEIGKVSMVQCDFSFKSEYNEKETYSNIEHASNGLEYIIDAFRRLVGKDTIDYYPIESSLETLKIMENVFEQIGINYNC